MHTLKLYLAIPKPLVYMTYHGYVPIKRIKRISAKVFDVFLKIAPNLLEWFRLKYILVYEYNLLKHFLDGFIVNVLTSCETIMRNKKIRPLVFPWLMVIQHCSILRKKHTCMDDSLLHS